MKIKILNHGYQRNGVMSEGFYYFQIECKDGGDTETLIASLTVDCNKEGEYPEKFNGSCRVINPANLDTHYRGDNFEVEIRKLHAVWVA